MISIFRVTVYSDAGMTTPYPGITVTLTGESNQVTDTNGRVTWYPDTPYTKYVFAIPPEGKDSYRYFGSLIEYETPGCKVTVSVGNHYENWAIFGPDPPGKAQSPTPEDDEGNISKSLSKLQWEAPNL